MVTVYVDSSTDPQTHKDRVDLDADIQMQTPGAPTHAGTDNHNQIWTIYKMHRRFCSVMVLMDRRGFHRLVMRQEVGVLANTGDRYTQGQLQYLGSHDSRTKINQDLKYCWGECWEEPTSEKEGGDGRNKRREGG